MLIPQTSICRFLGTFPFCCLTPLNTSITTILGIYYNAKHVKLKLQFEKFAGYSN